MKTRGVFRVTANPHDPRFYEVIRHMLQFEGASINAQDARGFTITAYRGIHVHVRDYIEQEVIALEDISDTPLGVSLLANAHIQSQRKGSFGGRRSNGKSRGR